MLKGEKSVQNLKTIFGQNIYKKWDHCHPKAKILDISYKCQIFSLTRHELSF